MKSYDKSKCQCGRIHILLGLSKLPGEALTCWWLSIAMEAPAAQFQLRYALLPSAPRMFHLRPRGHPGICRFHSPGEMSIKFTII